MEDKKNNGRAQLYSDDSAQYARDLENRRKSAKPQDQAAEAAEEKAPLLRRREQENVQKIRILTIALAVLTVWLIIELIYQVGLGHGILKTGNERMAVESSLADGQFTIEWDEEKVTIDG